MSFENSTFLCIFELSGEMEISNAEMQLISDNRMNARQNFIVIFP